MRKKQLASLRALTSGTRLSCWLVGSIVCLGHSGTFSSASLAVTMEERRRWVQRLVVYWLYLALPG